MKTTLLLLIASAVAVLSSCKYDSEEELYGKNSCDTTTVTYLGTIQPIMAANCNSCHTGANPEAGIITSNYEDLIPVVNSGIFWKVINHEHGVPPMPHNQPKLSQCDLDKIQAWINQGALNN